MVFDNTQQGIILRVRLTPNSSCCKIGGVFIDPNDDEMTNYYNIDVTNSIELFYDTYQKYILNEKN